MFSTFAITKVWDLLADDTMKGYRGNTPPRQHNIPYRGDEYSLYVTAKSITFARDVPDSRATKTFDGFRSRWMILF